MMPSESTYRREIGKTAEAMAQTARLMRQLAGNWQRFDDYCVLAATYDRLNDHLKETEGKLAEGVTR